MDFADGFCSASTLPSAHASRRHGASGVRGPRTSLAAQCGRGPGTAASGHRRPCAVLFFYKIISHEIFRYCKFNLNYLFNHLFFKSKLFLSKIIQIDICKIIELIPHQNPAMALMKSRTQSPGQQSCTTDLRSFSRGTYGCEECWWCSTVTGAYG